MCHFVRVFVCSNSTIHFGGPRTIRYELDEEQQGSRQQQGEGEGEASGGVADQEPDAAVRQELCGRRNQAVEVGVSVHIGRVQGHPIICHGADCPEVEDGEVVTYASMH